MGSIPIARSGVSGRFSRRLAPSAPCPADVVEWQTRQIQDLVSQDVEVRPLSSAPFRPVAAAPWPGKSIGV